MTFAIGGHSAAKVLDELRRKHGVVGATLAVLHNGEAKACAAGLLNTDTRVEATPDSIFQIGSIGKVFTATLIMQLVDEGRVDLDDPVRTHLPEFVVGDRVATEAITVRQLLCHTSGIDGDFFPADDPDGPSAASYLSKMHRLGQLHPTGAQMSYCNAGYVVAGRIVEALRHQTWQTAVMERICAPLGMTHAFAHPQESLRFRCAMGHVRNPEQPEQLVPASATYLPLSSAAAGAALSVSAPELLKFARCHMDDGRIGDGAQLLSGESARAMRKSQVELAPHTRRALNHWGLGWYLGEFPGYRVCGHAGGTLGHYCWLMCVPEQNFAFALLTNSISTTLIEEIESLLLGEFAGLNTPAEPAAESWVPNPDRFVGLYENAALRLRVEALDEGLRLTQSDKQFEQPEETLKLIPYSPDCFETHGERPEQSFKISFVGEDEVGRAAFVRSGSRLLPRSH